MDWYEEVEHTADWSFRIRGRDLPELFANAARAMFSLEHPTQTGSEAVTREFEVHGWDRETLLVNWLNELLYLHESHREWYDQFNILEITDRRLRALIQGRHPSDVKTHIKAATFHNLELKHGTNGWEATLVLDV
mgnify:CR=1 FL=1